MNQRILYKTDSGVAVVIPSGEEAIELVIAKAVPPQSPYWIVEVEDIPADREFRNAWVLDDSVEPTGVTA